MCYKRGVKGGKQIMTIIEIGTEPLDLERLPGPTQRHPASALASVLLLSLAQHAAFQTTMLTSLRLLPHYQCPPVTVYPAALKSSANSTSIWTAASNGIGFKCS